VAFSRNSERGRSPTQIALINSQALEFHPNISFRGPKQLWVRAM
jgi:hypothetical protein